MVQARHLLLGVLCLVGFASIASASTCENVEFEKKSFTVCTVKPEQEKLRLFLFDKSGNPYGHFSTISDYLGEQGQRLEFAMNAGMYHSDRAPVGHYVENGNEIMRVIPNAGPGNFGLLPNGILCITDSAAHVIETLAFIERKPDCRDATQSGPMLVIDGELHPRFLVDSTSRYIRNGVGTSNDGKTAVFAISNTPVTFHEFGSLFRDYLKMPQALYFDGKVSRLHAPELRRSDVGFWLGPIIGTVAPAD